MNQSSKSLIVISKNKSNKMFYCPLFCYVYFVNINLFNSQNLRKFANGYRKLKRRHKTKQS